MAVHNSNVEAPDDGVAATSRADALITALTASSQAVEAPTPQFRKPGELTIDVGATLLHLQHAANDSLQMLIIGDRYLTRAAAEVNKMDREISKLLDVHDGDQRAATIARSRETGQTKLNPWVKFATELRDDIIKLTENTLDRVQLSLTGACRDIQERFGVTIDPGLATMEAIKLEIKDRLANIQIDDGGYSISNGNSVREICEIVRLLNTQVSNNLLERLANGFNNAAQERLKTSFGEITGQPQDSLGANAVGEGKDHIIDWAKPTENVAPQMFHLQRFADSLIPPPLPKSVTCRNGFFTGLAALEKLATQTGEISGIMPFLAHADPSVQQSAHNALHGFLSSTARVFDYPGNNQYSENPMLENKIRTARVDALDTIELALHNELIDEWRSPTDNMQLRVVTIEGLVGALADAGMQGLPRLMSICREIPTEYPDISDKSLTAMLGLTGRGRGNPGYIAETSKQPPGEVIKEEIITFALEQLGKVSLGSGAEHSAALLALEVDSKEPRVVAWARAIQAGGRHQGLYDLVRDERFGLRELLEEAAA